MPEFTFDYDRFQDLVEETGFDAINYLDRSFPSDKPWPRPPTSRDIQTLIDVVAVDIGEEEAEKLVESCKTIL